MIAVCVMVKHMLWVYSQNVPHVKTSQGAQVKTSLPGRVRAEIGQESIDDRKSFFAYVRRKSKSNVKVGSLSTGQGLVSDAKQKAQVLNDFFGSVFTKEDITDSDGRFPNSKSKI